MGSASNLQLLPLALPRAEFQLFGDSEIPGKSLKIKSGSCRTRTGDPLLKRQMLYRLS